MLKASSIGGERFAEIGTHIVKQLCSITKRSRIRRIEELEQQTRQFLIKDLKLNKMHHGIEVLTWPFRVARRISTEYAEWEMVSEKEYALIVKTELR